MKGRNLILIIFIVAKFVMQYFAIDSGYELQRDEFLHLDLGRHLAFGYTSVPPVTGLISFFIQILGNSVFWVKFFPALFGALIIYIVWKTVEELNGGLFALILASVSVLFSIFLRINTLYQPNSLDFLLWTLFLFTIIKYLNTGKNKWIYFASMVFSFGFLNKYNIVFLLLGIIPAFILSKNRRIFINKHLYYAAALALLIILPNLVWQYKNDFPVFDHLQTLSDYQLVNVKRIDFLTEQLYFFSGSLFVILLGFISFFSYPEFRKYRILFLTFIFTITVFVFLKAKNYYSIGLYPVYIAFGAVYLEKLLSSGWIRYLRIPVLLIPIVVFIPIAPLILPILSPHEIMEKKELFDKFNLTRWEDGKVHDLPQDYADMLGWKELAEIVDSALTLVDEKDRTIVHCDNYGQAGAINYYSKELNTEALSMNADYKYWYPLEKFEIKHVILVKDIYDTDKDRLKEKPIFENVSLVGEIKNKYARESGTTVYLLQGAKQSINDILRDEINNTKNYR